MADLQQQNQLIKSLYKHDVKLNMGALGFEVAL